MSSASAMHIVFPLIDLCLAQAAVPVALSLARSLGSPLHFIASGEDRPTLPALAQQLSISPSAFDGATITIENAPGNIVDAVVNAVKSLKPALVILAVRIHAEAPKRNGMRHGVPHGVPPVTPAVTPAVMAAVTPLGAIERQVMEKVPCPVLIVPPDQDTSAWCLCKELLPQDGTPECVAALAHVIDRSSRIGVENLVLRVAGAGVGQPTEPGSLPTPRYVDHPQYEWDTWAQEFLARIAGSGANLEAAKLRLLVAAGEPAAEILRIAQEEGVDMIILPWHRTLASGRARMVKTVLDAATCPVLLLPQRHGGSASRGNGP